MTYNPPLAATLSGASVRQLAYWRKSTPRHGALFLPEHGTRPRVLYSYRDIVALRMFVKLRGDLSLQRVRKIVIWLHNHTPNTHLSTHKVRALPGEQTAVWISPDGDFIDVVERPGQMALKIVMEDVFREFLTPKGVVVPDLYEPTGGVQIDPAVRSGYPVISGSRIPFHVIAGLHADGVPASEISQLYPSVSEGEIAGAAELAEMVANHSYHRTAA